MLSARIMIVSEITIYTRGAPSGEIRAKHLRWEKSCGDREKIIMAERFADGKGAQILWNVGSLEEAKQLAEEDPFVEDNLLTYELREWPVIFDCTVKPPIIAMP